MERKRKNWKRWEDKNREIGREERRERRKLENIRKADAGNRS